LTEAGPACDRLTHVPTWLPGVPIGLAGWQISGGALGPEGIRMQLRV